MHEVTDFGLIVLVVAAVIAAAILSNRLTERLRVPAPALFLVGAAVAAKLFPGTAARISIRDVERIAVVALVVILFDGGMRIGWRRFRAAAVPIVSLGVVGTFATAAVVAAAARLLLGLDWTTAGLLGAALAPTDPAVMFSVLGGRQVAGRASTILEGESGANDPVGIALMLAMVAVASAQHASVAHAATEVARELAVGVGVGVAGSFALAGFLRRIRLADESLYPLRTLAGAGVVYGAASALHGSGFLAVFVAGILLGDREIPEKLHVERFQKSLASLAEIVVFVALGLSVHVVPFANTSVWTQGLVLAAVVALVARPIAVGPLLVATRLTQRERLFVVWGGLKGAVPILLAAFAVLGDAPDAPRIYGIVFVVVACSVLVQGATIPLAAGRLVVPAPRVRAPAEARA